MRSSFLLGAAFVVVVTACGTNEPLGAPCAVSADCENGQICVDGGCVKDPAGALPIGEGEGEGKLSGEGEGKGDEGEGGIQFGEGEGEGEGTTGGEGEGGVGGEGEGVAGEGEGGVAGEGEGEGEGAPPTCNPDCGPLMSCSTGDVCRSNGDDVCQAFNTDPTTLASPVSAGMDFDSDQHNALDSAHALRFDFDVDVPESYDSLWITRKTVSIRSGMFVHYDAIPGDANLDPVLFAVDPNGGCGVVGFSDNGVHGEPEGFDIDFKTTSTNIIIAAGTCDRLDGGICFAGETPTGETTGTIEMKAKGILCPTAQLGATAAGPAADDVCATQDTYDFCFRALFETPNTSNTCANSNPCGRAAGDKLMGSFCGLNANSGHTPGTAITLHQDLNACCSTDHTKNVAPCPTN